MLISASRQKGLLARGLELDYFVEDRLENALDVAAAGTTCYLLDRPYNRTAADPAIPSFILVSSMDVILSEEWSA